MTCGYCSEIGHTMRNCNSTAAQRLLEDYRRTCMTPRTDEELSRFFRSFTADMLSIIMYSYGARSVSVNRAAKEEFIRERILQARGQPALVIDLTAIDNNQPRFVPRSPVGPPPPPQVERVRVVRETISDYKERMKVIADSFFIDVCVRAYGIIRYTDDNSDQFREMIETLSVCLIAETRNSMPDSLVIAKFITKQFHLRRVIAPDIKRLFFTSIYGEHRRINDITLAGLRVQGLLPPAQPQMFLPHKPRFATIQLVDVIAAEAEDYYCGVCSDEFTKETLPTLNCHHTLCAECITGQIKARTKSYIKCPYCREEVKQISVGNVEVRNQLTHALVSA